jgi:hypothetical protein
VCLAAYNGEIVAVIQLEPIDEAHLLGRLGVMGIRATASVMSADDATNARVMTGISKNHWAMGCAIECWKKK